MLETFCDLQEEVARELNVPVECQRFWLWAKRQNHTYRPNRPLTDQEEAQTVTLLSGPEAPYLDVSVAVAV